MVFSLLSSKFKIPTTVRNCGYLIKDNWDDWSFKTSFLLIVVDSAGRQYEVGPVKIGENGLEQGSPGVPKSFSQLDDRFFSVGRDENYYETLYSIDEKLAMRVLTALQDCAYDNSVYLIHREEKCMEVSLLRSITEETLLGKLSNLAQGIAELTNFDFSFKHKTLDFNFKVEPNSLPPTNVHVLIGRNGVGKTTCLNAMIDALIKNKSANPAVFKFRSDNTFANLVSVSFSAFDVFDPPHTGKHKSGLQYSYVGLRESDILNIESSTRTKSIENLVSDFISSAHACRLGLKKKRWHNALSTLESDPLFQSAEISQLSETSDWEKSAKVLYENLSSGHKSVLLTITRLVELVGERTLVLIDEPESHLHPPLLSAFVRALSGLLRNRNGVAIIATHSPVVLQEVPRTCAWILNRSGSVAAICRPEIETFGENIGILTQAVFGLEVTHSGFKRLLEEVASNSQNYSELLVKFDNKLGAEGRAIARTLFREVANEKD